jgi:hypothetical protein
VLLHTFNKFIRATLPRIFCYSVFYVFMVGNANADDNGDINLPAMTVFAIKNADNTFKEISEVEWLDTNDLTIVVQKDGSYSPSSTTNSYSLNMLLASLGRPTVNIDLSYAAGSTSMTAEGALTIKNLIESFKYLGAEATLELTPTFEASNRVSKQLMQRRLEELKSTLARNSQVDFKIRPAKILRLTGVYAASVELWRIQLRRA